MDTSRIQLLLREFAHQRNWERYHTPKNLAIALSVEVSELLEIFQWLSEDEVSAIKDNPKLMAKINEEFADSMIYLLRFADLLDLDIETALERKIARNAEKYPAGQAGDFVKYSERE